MAEAATNHNSLIYENRLERRNRLLGRLALEPESRLRNNDSLAHIWLILEAGNAEVVEQQIRLEFRDDMSERSAITGESVEARPQPFYKKIDFQLTGDELVYAETGQALSSLLADGLTAAQADFDIDQANFGYHLNRAKVLAGHADAIVRWRRGNPEGVAMISSLCPPSYEVSAEVAAKGNFKPDRAMASQWLLEATDDGVAMHVFSQDNLTPESLQHIYDQLGLNVRVHRKTISELAEIRPLNKQSAAEAFQAINRIHDQELDRERPLEGRHSQGIGGYGNLVRWANEVVAKAPEAEAYYLRAVKNLAASLESGRLTQDLAAMIMDLRSTYADAGQMPDSLRINANLNLETARQFMDYLRSRALPEYIFGDRSAHQQSATGLEAYSPDASDSHGDYAIAAAGSYTIDQNFSREGDCPSSPESNQNPNYANAEVSALMGIHSSKQEFESKWCPNCLKTPKPGKSVKAWRQGEHIGCSDCGHVVNVCTGEIVKKGKHRIEKLAVKSMGVIDRAISEFAESWQRLSIKHRLPAKVKP